MGRDEAGRGRLFTPIVLFIGSSIGVSVCNVFGMPLTEGSTLPGLGTKPKARAVPSCAGFPSGTVVFGELCTRERVKVCRAVP